MRPLSRRAWAFDVGLMLLLLVAGQYELRAMPESGYQPGPLVLNSVVTVLVVLPLALRRRWPVAALVAATAPHLVVSPFVAHALVFWGGALPLMILCYSVGRWSTDWRLARWALAAPVLMTLAYGIHVPDFVTVEDYVVAALSWGVPWVAGSVIRRLHDQGEELRNALAELATLEGERQSRAVLDERTRIARELHDVMAHGVSLMVVQAGAARLDVAPEATHVRESLFTVERTGRRVLDELRRTVGLLRGNDPRSSEPSPGVRELPALAHSMRESGLSVDLRLDDALVELDPGRSLTVYRVVQEALTNALRHAGPTRVSVTVAMGREVELEVVDRGGLPQEHGSGAGHGLIGMQERVELYGGRLRTGPEVDGFAVHAVIPLEVGE